MTTLGRGNYLGVDDALDDDGYDEYRQSTTACCPRQTIPDSCGCLDGCACLCADCDCGGDEDDYFDLKWENDLAADLRPEARAPTLEMS